MSILVPSLKRCLETRRCCQLPPCASTGIQLLKQPVFTSVPNFRTICLVRARYHCPATCCAIDREAVCTQPAGARIVVHQAAATPCGKTKDSRNSCLHFFEHNRLTRCCAGSRAQTATAGNERKRQQRSGRRWPGTAAQKTWRCREPGRSMQRRHRWRCCS